MRTRIESSHIGELDWAKVPSGRTFCGLCFVILHMEILCDPKVKRKGFIRDHWLIFGTGLLTFKYFPFFNYYFGIKVFGTSMVCVTFWTILNRFVANISRRNEYMAAQKTAQDVMHGEDKILLAMSRFANDAKSVEHLQGFKTDVEVQIGSYKQALVEKMKADLTERAVKQLQLISVFEAGMGSALQQLVVQEAASSFRAQFPGDVRMKELAFSGAVKALAGETLTVSDDPVASFCLGLAWFCIFEPVLKKSAHMELGILQEPGRVVEWRWLMPGVVNQFHHGKFVTNFTHEDARFTTVSIPKSGEKTQQSRRILDRVTVNAANINVWDC